LQSGFAQHAAGGCGPAHRDSLLKQYTTGWTDVRDYNSKAWQLHFDSLIAICPNIAEAYQLKALPFIKYGDYAMAMPLEDKAVALDPSQYLAYRAFLKCIFTKDYEGALVDFQRAEKLFPGRFEMDHSYFFYEGLCYFSLNKYKLAEAAFKKDIFAQTNGDPKKKAHFNSLLYAGILYYAMKNNQQAKYYLLQCLEQYKMLPYANYYLAKVYQREKNKGMSDKYLMLAKAGFEAKYSLNEANEFYVHYPFIPTANAPDPEF